MKEGLTNALFAVAIVLQLIAYYSVYTTDGFFTGKTAIMTVFPPYAWYEALKFVGLF
jgi:hypothetical protein